MDRSQLTEANWDDIEAAAVALLDMEDFRYLVENHGEPLTFTRKSVADFDKARLNSWHEPGRRHEDRHAVYYCGTRAIKGGPPQDFAVIDCGGFRAIIQI